MAVRQKKQEEAPPGAPLWMVTYSDMITQVLAFFIMLFSFSSINEQKFAQAIASLQGAFGVLPAATQVMPLPLISGGTGEGKQEQTVPISVIERELKSALKDEKGDQSIRTEQRDGSLVLHFDAAVLFDSGHAEIKPGAHTALDAVAEVLLRSSNHVRIEGHTDSDPMIPNQQFSDNWDLGYGRARMVMSYFTSHGIRPQRMYLASFADTVPVASNDTPEGKALNRRVDIVILK